MALSRPSMASSRRPNAKPAATPALPPCAPCCSLLPASSTSPPSTLTPTHTKFNRAKIRELFPDTPKLRELWMRVYTFETLTRPATPHESSIESLTAWRDENDRRIQTLAESEYGKPIDDLTAYLLDQLPH